MRSRAANKYLAPFLAVAALVAVTACGGQTFPEVFLEENAWQGGVPDDAQVVTPDEFRRLVANGEVELTSTILVEEAAAARELNFDEQALELESIVDPSPVVQDLLDSLAGVDAFAGDQPVARPTGEIVVLEGLGTQLDNTLLARTLADSAANALIDYRQSYMLLPDELKSGLPTPDSLANAALEAIQQALRDLDAALAGSGSLGTARLEPSPSGPPMAPAQTIAPGMGNDQDAACAAPTGLAALYWFPLKNFISPMKNQGMRGTCWAFTTVGAIESRERVQNANAANLSEQFLVNKVKEDWDESDFTDGYNSVRAANLTVDNGQVLPDESGWTYNTSPNRPNVPDGNSAAYANACDPYGVGPNAGTCSDTSHQSRRVCSTFIFTVCGYSTVNFGGPGVASSRAYQLWANGQSFDLNRYRMLLSQGYVVMASFPLYKGFMDDVGSDGIVSNYAQTQLDATGAEVAGSYGGHAVQIVGFISNEEMSKPGRTPVNIGGGGYFIIKNSWGCGVGDGGYYYVPADYVSRLFNSLSALAFDLNRSAAWTAEQTTPGGSEAPVIEIRTSPANIDLRVETDLATFFKVSHPVANGVTLKVSSATLGTLYNGAWNTDPDVLFGSSLKYVFQQAGDHYLTLEARYGSSVSSGVLLARVINSAPTLSIQSSGLAYQDEPFAMSANVGDKNQSDVGALCSNTTWSVTSPDALSMSTGCQVDVTFGSSDIRIVSVTVRDAENLTTTRSVAITVQPPRENPFPVITTSGVYSLDSAFINGQFIGCRDVAVPTGGTIDLREKGCSLAVVGGQPQRYSAGVSVENPSGEALTYDWRLVLSFPASGTERVFISATGASEPEWELYSTGNSSPGTSPCRIEVVVRAPDPSRNKSKTVWSGQCTYFTDTIR